MINFSIGIAEVEISTRNKIQEIDEIQETPFNQTTN